MLPKCTHQKGFCLPQCLQCELECTAIIRERAEIKAWLMDERNASLEGYFQAGDMIVWLESREPK